MDNIDKYIEMCLQKHLITLIVTKDYGYASQIYHKSFSDMTRIIEVTEDSFIVLRRLDHTIPACPVTRTNIQISNLCVLISSDKPIEPGQNIFRLTRSFDSNPNRKYRLQFLNRIETIKRKRENNLLEEIDNMKYRMKEMEKDIDYLKGTIDTLLQERQQS